eukprot:UN09561
MYLNHFITSNHVFILLKFISLSQSMICHFNEKLHLSWDIHPAGKGNGARKKWKTGKCRIFVVHYGRAINTCVIFRFQFTHKT